jgi:hypothetical protein
MIMGINLVTKAEYKTYAGISSPNQDAEIDSLIPKVSQLVKTYCRTSFVDNVDEAKIEVFKGGEFTLYLKEFPVIAIASVEYSADYGQNYTSLIEYTDWVFDSNITAVISPIVAFPAAINGYRISYTCGYEVLPEDLKLAVLDLVTYYRKNDTAIHSSKAPGTNSVQIEYVSTTTLPAHIRRILDQYIVDFT